LTDDPRYDSNSNNDTTEIDSWPSLRHTALRWFHEPDLGAYKLTLAVAHTRTYKSAPVWLFLIGPSGTGKTALHCNSLLGLERAFVLGSLTPRTFLSCKRGGRGLLTHRVIDKTTDALLVFKDFTTLLSQRDDDQREIMGQLREIHDGLIRRDTGEITREWTGRVTIVAATTPGIDHMWSVSRIMGDRFLSIRLPQQDSPEMTDAAALQNGYETEITAELQEGTRRLLAGAIPYANDCILHPETAHLARLVVALRAHVYREKDHGKILEVASAESPARVRKALESTWRALDELFGPDPAHAALITRLALESTPVARLALLRACPLELSHTTSELAEYTHLPLRTVQRHAEDLVALGLWEERGGTPDLVGWTDRGSTLVRAALPGKI
jgi:hypothetical protein